MYKWCHEFRRNYTFVNLKTTKISKRCVFVLVTCRWRLPENDRKRAVVRPWLVLKLSTVLALTQYGIRQSDWWRAGIRSTNLHIVVELNITISYKSWSDTQGDFVQPLGSVVLCKPWDEIIYCTFFQKHESRHHKNSIAHVANKIYGLQNKLKASCSSLPSLAENNQTNNYSRMLPDNDICIKQWDVAIYPRSYFNIDLISIAVIIRARMSDVNPINYWCNDSLMAWSNLEVLYRNSYIIAFNVVSW